MVDVLRTSVSGLLAFQKALGVTSNNVANVSTPGYSVESALFTPQLGESTSIGNFGTGVQVTGVVRSYSELLAGQMRSSQSSYSSFNAYATTAASVDNMLSDPSTGREYDKSRRAWFMALLKGPGLSRIFDADGRLTAHFAAQQRAQKQRMQRRTRSNGPRRSLPRCLRKQSRPRDR